jgi:hypothetical protein
VFAARCAACHGPDLEKPRGRFGYALDLARIAANPEMVIPFKPDESELWHLVQRDEMPPQGSPRGRPGASEKEIIRAWITAGAPPAAASALQDSRPNFRFCEQPDVSPATWAAVRRFLAWFGKFHLLDRHFPIALVAAAAIAGSWSALRRSRLSRRRSDSS